MHRENHSSSEWLYFAAYTALGYLALAIHQWVFVPDIEDVPSGLQISLVMVNLIAGFFCFTRALRAAWCITR